ncbi:MAG TPA: YbaB/EbfC family nucleoid-associated protein [Trueperaceae bacterium]|nr:YbaB/EbfC family nucleoid-associated protein [Trueperaceae bacterium]HLU83697.1 YbaB/EbfC family nucleoid-associated protein [Trueperaceae bacterium]
MNIQKLMKEAQRAQRKVTEAQERLAAMTVEGTAGAGMVTATVTGDGSIVSVRIEKSVVDPDDVEMLEDLVKAAVAEAQRQAKEIQEREMGAAMGGMGGMGGLGGLG